MVANFRSTCGRERGAPACSSQRLPGGAPQVGQVTEDSCFGVSSLFFILTECVSVQPRVCAILDKSRRKGPAVLSTGQVRLSQALG
jgi:hypothetical protein